MPTLRGFPFHFDPLQTLARQQASDDEFTRGEVCRRAYAAGLAELQGLLVPAIAYGVYPVCGPLEGGLAVSEGRVLHSPVVARLFAVAPEIVAMVYTIGPRLEARVSQLQAEGDLAVAYTLDALGNLALSEVGYVACREIDRLAATKGVRASIPLNPGTTHWPARDQPLVVELSGAAAIGVTVSDAYLLQPYKSNSMAIALGTDVLTPDQGSSCDYCENSYLCRQRPRS